MGPVVPPSPQIPSEIKDLAAVERGDQILITFTTPARTRDFLPIEEFSNIDLRVGPSVEPFNQQQWEAAARTYLVAPTQTPAGDETEARSLPVQRSIPVSDWNGKKVDVLVRTAVKKRGHFSAWSNLATLDVVQPLDPPEVKLQPTAAGYRLTWSGTSRATRFEILRQGPGEKAPAAVGFSEKPEYVDGTAQWDTTYSYNVVAQLGKAESLPSKSAVGNSPDKFAPAVPAGIVALAAPESIELSWNRNDEIDFKGYEIFRSVNGGPFERLGDLLTLPSYSDRKAQHGKQYRYSVSAIDQKGNLSDKSAPVEVAY